MPQNFVEILRERRADRGDREALVFVDDPRAGARESVTYAELDRDARRVAARLAGHAAPDDRALLLHPSGPGFARAFFGCLYAGVIPVPAPPPEGTSQQSRRVAGIVRNAGVAVVLADGDDLPRLRADLAPGLGPDARWLDTATGDADEAVAEDAVAAPPPDAPAFLQYTSGSTSDPKGVIVSHANLLHNAAAVERHIGLDGDGRIGGWLPWHHDMGLIGLFLQSVYQGLTCVVMAPITFLKRPHRWLETIDLLGVNATAMPDFAYDLCVRRVTGEQLAGLDLSRWRVALDGSEPVRAGTLRAFAERFGSAGFQARALSPCYGLAEATLFVSGDPRHREPTVLRVDPRTLEAGRVRPAAPRAAARTLVSCGPAAPSGLRIVDPETGAELPDGHVGEIWVRGGAVALGYWNRPALTGRVFGATAADGEGGFLRTGDLGARLDGELYVTGRLKDVIVVRGRNLYPQDIEAETAGVHPALTGTAAAFAVATPRGDAIGVAAEIRPRRLRGTPLAEVESAIRRHLGREFATAVAVVVLVKPGTLARTTSGKIQRHLARAAHLEGTLERAEDAATAPATAPATDPAADPVAEGAAR
ncbi:fatty acyl-AMP ligase [Actinomadura viridis]|uniref:Acyl-CoA synthetase (AMP-forming)/AMP-acid ligase II n=1 Tax=Actinomadura viridis TaxID=58110 RepID=A0A931D9C7_9ACTN|nr:fatty acyl-AMP ligase [Actinomadura viridis]MBG6086849.1 acyl-CoA synthetase (AMP-forming)/AMP-acid ligase II [Actinomadura viridis]